VDADLILDALMRGALGGRGKRWRGTRRAVGRHGSLVNATTLLAAAGVAWGVYETWQAGQPAKAAPTGASPGPMPPLPGPGRATPPPLPGASASPAHPEHVVRLVRLMISAAGADGHLAPAERTQILEEAHKVGAGDLVERELEDPRPLAEIVAGVTDPRLREDLYTLAFSIVRADETVTGGERIYLAQLAHRLELDTAAVARLETAACQHIDEAASLPPLPPIE
jgi:uncharacterized membrane protein YebE (DUF533 family)